MLHPLPPRPSLVPSSQSLSPIPSSSSQAQHSSSVSHLSGVCSICPSLPTPKSSEPTKYTCPRCSIRTCSLQCSNFHKSLYGCSGERDKVKYIKMNEYGYGELMNDYVYLEQVGRKVKDWGGEIVRDGLDQNSSDKKGKGKTTATSMRGARGNRNGSGNKSKRDILKLQLEARDIYMELLPLGMERRRLNQSTWDSRSQSASLTIEFILHPPHNPLTPSFEPITLLNHRNNLLIPLIQLLESHVQDRLQKASKASAKSPTGTTKTTTLPDWIHDLLPPHDPSESETPTLPFFLIRLSPPTELQKIDGSIPQGSKGRHLRFYRALGPNDPLSTSLRDIPFIEFPTIEVVDPDAVSEGDFDGVIVQETSGVLYHDHNHRSPKRRKVTVDKQAFRGFLDGYGSSGSASDGGEIEVGNCKVKSALEGLGGYDSSGDGEGGLEQQEQQPKDAMRDDSDSDEDVEVDLDPKALEELVKLAQNVGGQEEVEVDWDESE